MKNLTWMELMELVNSNTAFIDCAVHQRELRIGMDKGVIRIPLYNNMDIYFDERESEIDYWG